MQLSLAGLWQLSPLTDLSLPQGDLTFPAPLSQILPDTVSEAEVAAQEWHLMHDIEVDDTLLSFAAIDLVLAGIAYHAEVRVNGVAVFDCDGSQNEYRKDIRPYLQLGRNRFEILFLEEEEDWLIEASEEQDKLCLLGEQSDTGSESRMGIWQAPYLQCIRHIRLEHVTTEQIWHHGGGCEFLVDLHYTTYSPGLVSASVKFNGMTYHLPIDVRANQASALFQIEAPIYFNAKEPSPDSLYRLDVTLDGQERHFNVGLSEDCCVIHYPL
ncbi:glycosyl hydrolase 2 galactose-binding domain-containing protein [Vibrio sp. TRT 21S02]|uniref:glycosyl hydrolase 2 galactose-binding domain-containing protein n=1 Tax=Vibrio sp. TRT 21S02 TaxID=3418507 RepID=UPI003CED9423